MVRLYCGVPEVLNPMKAEAMDTFEEEAQRYLGELLYSLPLLGAQPMGAAQAGVRFYGICASG